MYVYLKFGENWITNMGEMPKMSISPILLLVVVVVLQFESLYLKNCKRYRSEILYTSWVQ